MGDLHRLGFPAALHHHRRVSTTTLHPTSTTTRHYSRLSTSNRTVFLFCSSPISSSSSNPISSTCAPRPQAQTGVGSNPSPNPTTYSVPSRSTMRYPPSPRLFSFVPLTSPIVKGFPVSANPNPFKDAQSACSLPDYVGGHKITNMEMIKGIPGHGYFDELVVSIIDNTAYERELKDSLAATTSHLSFVSYIEAYPNSTVVLVRNPGIYVWGDSRISAKTQGILLLFHSSLILFPFAGDNVGRNLDRTFDTPETQSDIKLPRAQNQHDLEKEVAGAIPVPPNSEGKEKVISALVANVSAMIKADREITSLKELQGHIWQIRYQNKELQGVVFEDVPAALERWHSSDTKVFLGYADVESASRERSGMNGRKFGGNLVIAVYYPENKFAQAEYDG